MKTLGNILWHFPFVLAKSLGTFFNPVNKKCVPAAVAEELERRAAQGQVERHLSSE